MVVVVVLQTRGNKNLHHEVFSSVAENIASWLLMFKSLCPLASCQAASRARRKCQSLGRSEVIGGPKKRGAAAAAALDNRTTERGSGGRKQRKTSSLQVHPGRQHKAVPPIHPAPPPQSPFIPRCHLESSCPPLTSTPPIYRL